MMHPIIPSANVKQQRYSKTNNTGNIVSKTGEVLLSIVTLTHSFTQSHISMILWLHLPKDTVAIKRERFPKSPILYHCFLYPRIVCMMKYGAAVLKSCRYLTLKKKERKRLLKC